MKILFVCTGNLCRSPMAEAIARSLAGGGAFESAGIAGLEGYPASENAVAACREIGVDLTEHQARRFSPADARSFDRIYVMTEDHLAEVLAVAPWAAARTDLLDPDGRDIDDPYGTTLDSYREARDAIGAAIRARLPEWS